MVITLEKHERAHNKLMVLPDGDRLRFEGGIATLTGEKGLELYEPYLNEIGRVTFTRKIAEQSFDVGDMNHVAQFLMQHDIQPTAENVFALVMGARLHMSFTRGS